MSQVPDQIRADIYAKVLGDLEPSLKVVHAKIGLSVGLGGLLSLLLCGQFGFGFGALSEMINASIMAQVGAGGCTAVCGILFAVVPVVTLRVLCPALQFLSIVKHQWHALLLWIAAFGTVLMIVNGVGNPLWEILVWTSAALLSFESIGFAIDRAGRALQSAMAQRVEI